MLRALLEAGITPNLVLGTSVGAVNGAKLAGEPTMLAVERLEEMWRSLSRSGVFSSSLIGQATRLARERTHLHSSQPLRSMLTREFGEARIEDLSVRFECVAANIESARPRWFDGGPLVDAVLASCAVPGLLPPAKIGAEHFFDGGLVSSIPFGRALRLGSTDIYVLQVGRVERALKPPRWPWEVGLVAFEIARRAQFAEDLASVPDRKRVHVLPTGLSDTPLASLRYRRTDAVHARIESAYEASCAYLSAQRVT
jgi:NTE family protein